MINLNFIYEKFNCETINFILSEDE